MNATRVALITGASSGIQKPRQPQHVAVGAPILRPVTQEL